MKKILISLFAFLLLAGGVGVFVTGRSDLKPGTAAGGIGEAQTTASRSIGFAIPSDQAVKLDASAPEMVADQMAGVSGGGDSSSSSASSVSEPFTPTTGSIGPKVIKTADLTVEVKAGTFDKAFGDAEFVAKKYGGYVMSSSTSGDKAMSGYLMIRVPSKNFDYAMNDLRGLGETKSESRNGQEVTDQFIDLNARLKTWQSQESVLLRLMDNANSISETMTVQRELQQVQYQIEQIKGQLRVLRDQTSYSTIAVTVQEPGGVTTTPKGKHPSLSEAWDKAIAGVMSIAYVIVVGLGYVVPLGLLALLGWAVVRRTRKPRVQTTIA